MNSLNNKNKIIILFLLFLIILSPLVLSIIKSNVYISAHKIQIDVQKTYDDLDIEYVCAGPNTHNLDVLNIDATVKVNDTGNIVEEDDMKVHKYHVYSDEDGTTEILTGDLEFNDKDDEWQIKELDLFWSGNGKFYITVEFQSDNMSKSVETDIDDSDKHTYSRASIWEIIIVLGVGLGIAFGVIITLIVLKTKRQGISIERKTKDPTKKEVKFKTLSEAEIKKAKKEKKNEKKEKGKTEVSEDLIFSVPKWEVEDDDDDEDQ